MGRWALALSVAALGFATAPAQASAKRSFEELKHALGWDTINLKVITKDGGDRATLEREDNAANRVERKTSYHPNGRKADETVSVVSNGSGKTLYLGHKAWTDGGDPVSVVVEDDVYSDGGTLQKGLTVDKQFKFGRLISEERKRYSARQKDWSPAYRQEISYYDDGAMKERVTQDLRPDDKDKVRESWGEKAADGVRLARTEKWDWTKGGY